LVEKVGNMAKKYNWLINKAEDYIEKHLSEKIKLSDIAHNLGISEYHFHRIYRNSSTETLNQFITRIKMERSAIYLVVDKKITITEIAFRYGYNDSSSYNRAFRKYFGLSPTQFRKEQEKSIILDKGRV
jgi:AraC-type DNA-binding domain-containing proteins